jgi:hypothetical protein
MGSELVGGQLTTNWRLSPQSGTISLPLFD